MTGNGIYIPHDQRQLSFTVHLRQADPVLGSPFVKCDSEEDSPEYAFFISESDSTEQRTADFIKNMLEIWQNSFICEERGSAAVKEILETLAKGEA